ncbi:MAG: GAF domain-containing sensor histidine kinase [Actinomycetia bacterium]|nr:GAF domain-containing sensor histidine kinase [Actinomycetes bacterium]
MILMNSLSMLDQEPRLEEPPRRLLPRVVENIQDQTARLRGAGGMRDDDESLDTVKLFEQVDRLKPFGPAILSIRWGTTVVSAALTVPSIATLEILTVFWFFVIAAYTVLRTVNPVRYVGDTRSLLRVLIEVGIHVLAVVGTGYWDSPLVGSLVTAIMVAGFARGFAFSLRIGIVSALAVSIPDYARADYEVADLALAAQWSTVLLLVAVVAGYARRISGEADLQQSLAIERLDRLADANALLFSLHRIAQTLPASLDYDDVLDSTILRLRGLLDFEMAAILMVDETDSSWQVVRQQGNRIPGAYGADELPLPVQSAVESARPVMRENLLAKKGGGGLAPSMVSGLYAPLMARGSLIGLVAVEHTESRRYGARDMELFAGFVEPVALAIDNARWFQRLRTVGADEERTRIARDLHDRIGQSLAYLAIELDRLVSKEQRGEEIGANLDQLRADVRGVISEVRDTLYDLRTDVSDAKTIVATLDEYVERVRQRSRLEITLRVDQGEERLPILQEREMWRIAQEALTNVERHAEATKVRILWRSNGKAAALEVADNGKGFPPGRAGRLDSYGILGMRERASSIGATLDIISAPGEGTRVRCYLAQA